MQKIKKGIRRTTDCMIYAMMILVMYMMVGAEDSNSMAKNNVVTFKREDLKIINNNTLTSGNTIIQLDGVNSLNVPLCRKYDCKMLAKKRLNELIGSSIDCSWYYITSNRKRGKCFSKNTDVGQAMIASGYSKHGQLIRGRNQHYRGLQIQAQKNKKGLWAYSTDW